MGDEIGDVCSLVGTRRGGLGLGGEIGLRGVTDEEPGPLERAPDLLGHSLDQLLQLLGNR